MRTTEGHGVTSARWSALVSAHRKKVVLAWVVAVAVSAVSYPGLREALGPADFATKGSQSAEVERLLESNFRHLGGEIDLLIYNTPPPRLHDRAFKAGVRSSLDAVNRIDYVKRVRRLPAQYSNLEVALITLSGDERARMERAQRVQDVATRAARGHGPIKAMLTGYSPVVNNLTDAGASDIGRAERIGVPVAAIILLLALGTGTAMAVSLLVAGAGLLTAYGILAVIAHFLRVELLLLTVVTMVGVGVGIDYTMFVVSRFREELAGQRRAGVEGDEATRQAVGRAIATSGRTVLISGTVVILALTPLLVMRTELYDKIAIGVAVVVACTELAVLTLLPALLAMLGRRIDLASLPKRLQPLGVRKTSPARGGGWARWARFVIRRPLIATGLAVAVLAVLALPLLHVKLDLKVDTASIAHTPAGEGANILGKAFSPDMIAPVEVVIARSGGEPLMGADKSAATQVEARLASDKEVYLDYVEKGKGSRLLLVVLKSPFDSPAAMAFVDRAEKIAGAIESRRGRLDVVVGGATKKLDEFIGETRSKFPLFLALILIPAGLMLTIAFRSVVVPIKAVAVNLLATVAALGVLVAVFQRGLGADLLGIHVSESIQVYVPVMMFALLFGLSMDYEVFFVGRVREFWIDTEDGDYAVAAGLQRTARPITAAGAIMIAVFGSFVMARNVEVQELGLAMAAAIAIDVTVVRLILVPATLKLLGKWNWWLPGQRVTRGSISSSPSPEARR